ncbi:MAG TPA: L-threonylcarbamoyladenylate synthase [Ignavibacteriales bacterium]|nr:L-threonylcarbamoyladenylate synthase [Ignavibacteriales bacterium]HOL80981.1 L-threonylcarbamoyladenylate synthase [Ignavibacteriales bacterium]HOM64716.1 L-threonylcarbamoyladenylate synthase [Ignavibacteriales bacterium]HPD66752.1 L-threonylcarbamoyladenylate synthase [Ignavibacteriales bacterium]HPP32761.1 L-threonylcarbamoyladenylate synthase [Ignavibacteriales bacterium]
MEFYEIHPVNPQERLILKAVEIMRNGGVVIYPTDTVYGIGCDIYNSEALERILSIKGDTMTKFLSFVVPDLKDISKYAKVSDKAFKIIKRAIPGPYTFILPASKEVPKKLWSKRNTVGIRVPDNKIAIMLAKELGNPIFSTSVTNRKGEIITDPTEIKISMQNQVDLMLSQGILPNKVSTVVDLTEDEIQIIREGAGDTSIFY